MRQGRTVGHARRYLEKLYNIIIEIFSIIIIGKITTRSRNSYIEQIQKNAKAKSYKELNQMANNC